MKMDFLNVEKTTFWTLMGNFHYTVIPFVLKNAIVTYQRARIAVFHDMLHDCLKDNVNDIIVKSKEVCNHVDDLRKIFMRCMHFNLRVDPLRCTFSVSSRKFLMFTYPQKDIDLNMLKPRPF